jgi:aspartate aminotransferase
MDMKFTDRVNRISVSPTMAVLMEAEKLKAKGVDVVDFGPGEPDFPTPEHIKQAAIRALAENRTKYTATAGIAPLREAVCRWHSAQFGTKYQPAQCVVTSGGKHAIYETVGALIDTGDEVVIPAPYWVSFPDIVKLAGGTPVFVPTKASDGFHLSAAQIEAVLTPRTRMVIVNSPCNPTGAVVPNDEFAKIAALCNARDIWLMSDECYSHFIYGGVKPFSIGSRPEAGPKTIVIGSLSKTFAMTGWRVGYALAPEPLIGAVVKQQSQSTSNVTSIAQYAAVAALDGSMESAATMLAEYARRRARIYAGLNALPGVSCTEPKGAFYAFPSVAARGGDLADTTAMAKALLDREHVAVVPGEAFGAPGFLRFSYATSIERIDEGLRRLGHFFSAAAAAS